MWIYFFAFMLSLGLSLYITPIVRKGALLYDIVDRPDGKLKNHTDPVAYLGGVAVYLAFLLTLALTFDLSREILGILLSGTIIVILGVIDDFKSIATKNQIRRPGDCSLCPDKVWYLHKTCVPSLLDKHHPVFFVDYGYYQCV